MSSSARKSATLTARAAREFDRRTVLKFAAAAASLTAVGPYVVRDARAAAEMHVLIWTNYLTPGFLKKFQKDTGIKVNVTTIGSNEELLNKVKSSKGRGVDLISPSANRKGQWVDLGLIQPWDLKKIPNLKNVDDHFLKASEGWSWGEGQYHLPHVWGTEALAWRTDLWQSEYGKLSFGDLWLPEMKGKIQGRPHSMMAGIGRYLEGAGKLPPFVDAYKNEDSMRKIWSQITKFAIERKPWVKQFWNDHDTQKVGFMQNGCVLGQTWDGPAIELVKEGKPMRYMAPKEGAFAWLDGLALPAGAKNLEHSYALVNALYTVAAGVELGNRTGYHSVVKGVAAQLDDKMKKALATAYPEDAMQKLWWWPDEPKWYAAMRAGYRDKFVAA